MVVHTVRMRLRECFHCFVRKVGLAYMALAVQHGDPPPPSERISLVIPFGWKKKGKNCPTLRFSTPKTNLTPQKIVGGPTGTSYTCVRIYAFTCVCKRIMRVRGRGAGIKVRARWNVHS